MHCPVCNVELKLAERQGIEIDYCPRCRGVWLDRGELDKIIERSAPGPRLSGETGPPRDPEWRRYEDDDHEYRGSYPHRRKKREGWLGELFDFD